MFQNSNRLAFGWNDPNTHEFKYTPHGLAYMLQNGKDMAFILGRSQVNLNLLMNIAKKGSMDILKQYSAFANATHSGLGYMPLSQALPMRAPLGDQLNSLAAIVQSMVRQLLH